ncbi:MAG: hypothetical protein K0U76_10840 [Actinomycetia bacterium]|nr:hypothetical protein [Actinomycetes bacterium]MCH9762590.1 hypothetical protein [Actinomycetes bacterium]
MTLGVRRIATAFAAVAVCLALAGCSQTVTGSPDAVPSATVSKTEVAAGLVKESMQRKLDTDPDLAKFGLKVIDVALVKQVWQRVQGHRDRPDVGRR